MNMNITNENKTLYGNEAVLNRGICKLSHLLKNSFIQNTDEVCQFIQNVTENELRQNSDRQNTMLLLNVLEQVQAKQKLTEFLFEKLNSGCISLQNQMKLSLFACGCVDGVVLDCGDASCNCCQIANGLVGKQIYKCDFGGNNLTEYLKNLMECDGLYFNATSELGIPQQIKESACYVKCQNCENKSTSYTLPDDKVINIGDSAFKCPEMLFNKSDEFDGMQNIIFNQSNELNQQNCTNVVTTGGSTMFKGFDYRLQFELNEIGQNKFKICQNENKLYTPFIGGTIIASINDQSYWISKEEYEEFGWSVVEKKGLL